MEYRVSEAQLEDLLEFLRKRPNLAKAGAMGPRSKEVVDREWNILAKKLNAHSTGASKTGQRWKRYWADLKHKVKARASARRRESSVNGGGPSFIPEFDEKILSILGEKEGNGDTQYKAPSLRLTTISHDGPSTSTHRSVSPSYQQLRNASPAGYQQTNCVFMRSDEPDDDNKIDVSLFADLERRRVEAEEKLASAAMITAEAARTQAEAAKTQAEAAKHQALATQTQSESLNKLIDFIVNKYK